MLGLVAVGLVAVGVGPGCGADDAVEVIDPPPPDAAIVACPALCDPLGVPGQQGCNTASKCTAIRTPPSTLCPTIPPIGCVPAGFARLGERCAWGPSGPTTGFDDCVAGALCAMDGVCRDICGFGGGANEACAGGIACQREPGLFEAADGRPPFYGSCRPRHPGPIDHPAASPGRGLLWARRAPAFGP